MIVGEYLGLECCGRECCPPEAGALGQSLVETAADTLRKAVFPGKPWRFIVGGAALVGISQTPLFRESPAKALLTVAGGVVVGIGILPILWDMIQGRAVKFEL